MTYIAAFRCLGGIVMCADTLETRGEYKNYTEKIEIVDDQSFPLAVAGAGMADVIEPISNEIVTRVHSEKPKTQSDLLAVVQRAIGDVYRDELPALVLGKQYRSPQFIVAAKPVGDDYCIFRAVGKRLYASSLQRVIIGYGNDYNNALLKRFHRSDLPIQQAVMLATYLVSQSKQFDEGVGGETRIVIVRENGAWIDDPQYIARFEEYIAEFIELIDQLFLTCLDVSIPPGTAFPAKLKDFGDAVTRLRNEALTYSAARNLERTFNDPTYSGDPYSKIFPGAVTEFGTSGIKVREDTPEELEARTKVFESLRERSVVKQVPMP